MKFVVTIGIALMMGGTGPAWALEPQDVVGTWKLLSNVRQVLGSDKVVDNLGSHPNGVMILTPEHRFTYLATAEGENPRKRRRNSPLCKRAS